MEEDGSSHPLALPELISIAFLKNPKKQNKTVQVNATGQKSFLCCCSYLLQDDRPSVGGVKHIKQLPLIEAPSND